MHLRFWGIPAHATSTLTDLLHAQTRSAGFRASALGQPAAHEGVLADLTTNICAMELLGAQVWHYWLAVPLTIVTVLTVAKLVAGYVQKVVAPRYPKR